MALKHDRAFDGSCVYCGARNVLISEDCPKRVNEKPPHATSFKPIAAAPENITIQRQFPIGSAQEPVESKLSCEHRWLHPAPYIAQCDKCGEEASCDW